MQVLLQHGADIDGDAVAPWSDHRQFPFGAPLRHAVHYRHIATVVWMLERGADASAALLAATRSGNPALMRLVLEYGADVASEGDWAMRTALDEGHLAIAHQLMAAGTPDFFMTYVDDYAVTDCLARTTPDKASALLQAAIQHGHVGFAQMLLQKGAALQ
jgi:hypothetical protein